MFFIQTCTFINKVLDAGSTSFTVEELAKEIGDTSNVPLDSLKREIMSVCEDLMFTGAIMATDNYMKYDKHFVVRTPKFFHYATGAPQ